MLFPPPRSGQNAVYAPLPPPPAPKTITQTEQQRRAEQFKEMKKFINEQTCPMCGSQLEGSIGYDRAGVYCCMGGELEYKAHYKFGILTPFWSVSTYYTSHFAFEIESTFIENGMYKNTIFKIDLSLNKKYQQLEKKILLSYEGAKLTFKRGITEEEILSKIKLYTVFS